MSVTPTKSTSKQTTYTPRELRTPNKEVPGIPRTVYQHALTFQGLWNTWERVCQKGTTICRTIVSLNLHEYDNEKPKKLGPLMEALVDALYALKDTVDGINQLSRQYEALAKLHPSDEPVINTWTAVNITIQMKEISEMFQLELKLKQCVTENIAHSKDERQIEVFASSWEYGPYIEDGKIKAFLTEMGLTSEAN